MTPAQLLTSSRASCARGCRRQHHLRYGLGYRAVRDVQTRRFGSLSHRWLEAWWRAAQAGRPQDAWLDAALAACGGDDVAPIDLAKAQVMAVGYHLRWKDEPLDVLGVEVRFEGALLNPETGRPTPLWRLAGKVDVIVRDRRDGRVFIVEHKTSSEDVTAGSNYWKRLKMDGQVSIYFEGARMLGHDVAACIYDVLYKPQLELRQVPKVDEAGAKIVLDAQGERVKTKTGGWRQTADEAQGFTLQKREETLAEYRERLSVAIAEEPMKYFARGEVVRLEEEMRGALLDVWQLAAQLREEALAGRYPRNPDNCVKYGSTCSYFGVCVGEESLEDPALFVKVDDVHPELAEAA